MNSEERNEANLPEPWWNVNFSGIIFSNPLRCQCFISTFTMFKVVRCLEGRLHVSSLSVRRVSSKPESESSEEVNEVVGDMPEPNDNSEAILEQKRNKSRLSPSHRNVVHDRVPYSDPQAWFHETVRYKQRMYGRYGSESGVNPGLMWPTKEDLKNFLEYERVAHPETLQEMMENVKNKRLEEEKALLAREMEINTKMAKLDGWMKEVRRKNEQKLAATLAAQEKKDKLVEEVRRHFGFNVDIRDPRFKELLEQKEKEQKKAAKEARKKEKQARLEAYLSESKSTSAPEEK